MLRFLCGCCILWYNVIRKFDFVCKEVLCLICQDCSGIDCLQTKLLE